jgi:hypothetical protein
MSNGAGLLATGDGNHQLVGIEVEHDGLGRLRDRVAGELTRLAPRPPSRDRTDLPTVDLFRALRAFKADRKRPRGDGTYPAGVRLIETELAAMDFLPGRLVEGYAGPPTIDAYRFWQHQLGYRGADADGLPGMTSLVRLGHRRYAATDLAIAAAVTRVLALPVVEAFLSRYLPFLAAGDAAADQVVALQLPDGPGQTVVAGEASVIATGTPLQIDTTVGDLGQTQRR